MPIRE